MRETIEKRATLASFQEIEENDYNLNIPRYVDTSEEEPEVDLGKLTEEMRETDKEIKEGTEKLLEMLSQLTFQSEETRADVEKLMEVLRR